MHFSLDRVLLYFSFMYVLDLLDNDKSRMKRKGGTEYCHEKSTQQLSSRHQLESERAWDPIVI